jgi:hypothetical protein
VAAAAGVRWSAWPIAEAAKSTTRTVPPSWSAATSTEPPAAR